MKKISYFVIAILLLLTSCEKVLDFDVDELEPLVVVNSLPCTDSQLFVSVTRSRFFLDNSPFPPAEGVTLELQVFGGPTLFPTHHDSAYHFFNYIAQPGDSLTLRVNVPGRDPIVGSTRIVPLPDMQPPSALIDTLQPIPLGDIAFTLTDPADTRNYYYIYVMERDSGSRWNRWEAKWDTIDTVRHAYFNCLNFQVTDPSVNLSAGMMGYFNELFFIDSLIDGQATDITVSLLMFKDTAEHPLLKEYTLVVESLSPDAFRYIKEVKAKQSATSYFAEPTRAFSNLSSGIGIFASVARRLYPLTFGYKEPDDE